MNFKKIILYSVIIIVVILAGYIAYIMLTTRSHSPAAEMEYIDGDFKMTIDYCRPYKKGRLIFGDDSEGALLPYGVYWRTGANEATEIEFNRDVSVNGNELEAGKYRFYTIPNEKEWEIAFNSELGKWGYDEPDYSQDVLRISMPVNQLSQPVEQFTIEGKKEGDNSMRISLTWDRTRVEIPVRY